MGFGLGSIFVFRAHKVGELLLCGQLSSEFSWQFRLEFVGGDSNGIRLAAEGILDFDIVFLGTKDDADRGLVTGGAFFFIKDGEVKIHLPCEFRLEWADFQVECHEGFQEPVVKEEVDEVFLFAGGDPVLASDKAESVAEFHEEGLEARDQAVFQLALLHSAANSQKLQVVGTLEHFLGLFGEVCGEGEGEVVGFFVSDGALVGTRFDLVDQNIAGPAEAGCGLKIPQPGGVVLNADERVGMVAPWHYANQFSHSL